MTDRSKYLYRKNGYIYFRHGGKLTPLHGKEGSAQFNREYDAASRAAKIAAEIRPIAPRATAASGSLAEALDVYVDSSAFDAITASTRAQYLHTIKQIKAHRLARAPLADIDTDAIDIYTDEITKLHGASVGERHKKLFSKMWRVCRPHAQFGLKGQPNPCIDAEKRYKVKARYRAWPIDVQEKFMRLARPHMQLAKLLLHYSAMRGCDVVKMKWSDYDGVGISVRQQKLNGEADALPEYYECVKPLRDALDAAPRLAETILANERGQPYANSNVLSNAIRFELQRLGLAKEGKRTWVMHGLRKTAASEVASFGGNVKATTGHRSDAEANYYAMDANRRRQNHDNRVAWDAELEAQARRKSFRVA